MQFITILIHLQRTLLASKCENGSQTDPFAFGALFYEVLALRKLVLYSNGCVGPLLRSQGINAYKSKSIFPISTWALCDSLLLQLNVLQFSTWLL